jgi:hypothetical protein
VSPWCGSKEACAPNDLESDMPAAVLEFSAGKEE